MFALWTAVTLCRPLATAYSKANRAIRSDASRVMILMLSAASRPDHVLDAGVQVLGVLADDDQVDVVVARLDARHRLGGAQVGVQPERLAKPDVDAPEPAADRGGDRALEPDLRPPHRLEDGVRERGAMGRDSRFAGLHGLPFEADPGRIEDTGRRLRQLRTDAVAWDERHTVGHASDCSDAAEATAAGALEGAPAAGTREGRGQRARPCHVGGVMAA